MGIDMGQIFIVLQSWAHTTKYTTIYDHLKNGKNDFVGPTLWKMVKIEIFQKCPKWALWVILTIKIDLGTKNRPRTMFSCLLLKVNFWANFWCPKCEYLADPKYRFFGQISTSSKIPIYGQIRVENNDLEVEKIWKCLKMAQNKNLVKTPKMTQILKTTIFGILSTPYLWPCLTRSAHFSYGSRYRSDLYRASELSSYG